MLKNFFKPEEIKTLEAVVKTLEKRGHENIRARLKGYKLPQNVVNKTNGVSFSPEITSVKNTKLRIFTIVTKKTLHHKELPEKWSLFAEFASQNDAVFHVVFLPELLSAVKEKLEGLNISASLWDISKKDAESHPPLP
jgi:hypothetical protein